MMLNGSWPLHKLTELEKVEGYLIAFIFKKLNRSEVFVSKWGSSLTYIYQGCDVLIWLRGPPDNTGVRLQGGWRCGTWRLWDR